MQRERTDFRRDIYGRDDMPRKTRAEEFTYNTEMDPLRLPEYGRNVQNMVDYCLTLEEWEERARCARTIVQAMAALLRRQEAEICESQDFERILWDHLVMLSDYGLEDVSPYETTNMEKLSFRPKPMRYPDSSRIRYRHYGRMTLELIQKCAAMPEGRSKTELAVRLASVMKKQYFAYNKATTDARILEDLFALSAGAIRLDPETQLVSDKIADKGAKTIKQMRDVHIKSAKEALKKKKK